MSNAEQVEYWNGKVGETWVRMQDRMDHALTPVTSALLSLAAPQPGEHILDVGCGSGETTLALANAAGEDGIVIGIDISEPLLARARTRAEELLSDAEFRNADASTFDDEADGFDLLVSRFGVMFFADPVAAFANLFRLARPGARLCFACWQPAGDNLWGTLPLQILADVLPPQPPADPHAPGPFAFADPEHTGAILAAAGWQNIAFHALSFGMVMGEGDDPVAAAVHFALRIGPAARAVRDAGPDVEAIAKVRLGQAFAAYRVDGQVALPAAVWLVSAQA
jgi:ubiquinone/menaquinone biosynthesis C-methylase UbiE